MRFSFIALARLRLWALLAPLTAGATAPGPTETPPIARAGTSATAPLLAPSTPTAKKSGHVVVIEDDNVRIEEVRSRGRVQSIHVQNKLGQLKSYDIQVAPAGRDPSQERGNAGQRTWSLISF